MITASNHMAKDVIIIIITTIKEEEEIEVTEMTEIVVADIGKITITVNINLSIFIK